MTTIDNSTLSPFPAPTSPGEFRRGRRVANRISGLLLGLAFPAGFLSWLFGFNPIKKEINGRLWCPGADHIDLLETIKSSANKMNINDKLVCSKNGAVYRTVNDLRMWPTTIGVAIAVSLLLVVIFALTLMTYGKLRRRVSPS